MSGLFDPPLVGSRGASFSLRKVLTAASISSASCKPLLSSFVFRIPSGVMRINIPNNMRHFVVSEEVRDRCILASAATATWRKVDVVDVQLLTIGHCDRNALLLQMRIG